MAKQDYLTEKGEVEMTWHGQGSERLGLSGQVDEDDFARVCDGLHPSTNEKLMVRDNKANRRVCYFGQISAPKDVSIAYLVGGDQRVADWWKESVKETLREIEGVTATRVHEGNKVTDRPAELLAAIVTHDTSRGLDPQLHTHVCVMNVTYDTVEKRWKAVEPRGFYQYQSYLREVSYNKLAEKMKEGGYQLEKARSIGFTIKGFPADLRTNFSKRREEIERVADVLKTRNQDALQSIATKTRAEKIHLRPEELKARWLAESVTHLPKIQQIIANAKPITERERMTPQLAVTLAGKHLFDRHSVVDGRILLREALIAGRGDVKLTDLKSEVASRIRAGAHLGINDFVTFILTGVMGGLVAFTLWPGKRSAGVVLKPAGVTWSEEDFCRGWEIDGRTGSGKTASAVIPIIYQLKKYRPTMGILALDTKGDLSEPLIRIAQDLRCEDQLVQLEVRPENAPPEWSARMTMNFLADRTVPYSTYAKLIVDVATAAGQRGGQAFFKVAAQTVIQNTFAALDALNQPVTVPRCAEMIADTAKFKELCTALEASAGTKPALKPLVQFFYEFIKQPPEQLGGVRASVQNYLQPYTAPDIAEVFCPEKPTFAISEIDQGKLISVKIPQKYQVEKKYIGLLLKTLFYLHALRRYDLSQEERASKNLIVMVLDEAQESVLVSEDGLSDHNVIDKIRGARATAINSTQSPTSYLPPMGGKDKADVFLLNLANQIHFTAADKQAAEIIAESIGKRTIKKRTYGRSGGKSSMTWREEEEFWIKPHVLRGLPKHVALIKHCEKHFKRARLLPMKYTLPPQKKCP